MYIIWEKHKWISTLIEKGAIPEQGVTTLDTHFSCTMKLQTTTKERILAILVKGQIFLFSTYSIETKYMVKGMGDVYEEN